MRRQLAQGDHLPTVLVYYGSCRNIVSEPPRVKSRIENTGLGQQLALVTAGLCLLVSLALVTLAAISSRHMQLQFLYTIREPRHDHAVRIFRPILALEFNWVVQTAVGAINATD